MNYFAILPGEVRYNDTLQPQVKLFYAELTAFANGNAEVEYNAKHFEHLFKVTNGTIKRWIERLRLAGLVFVENGKLFLNNRVTHVPDYTQYNDPPNTLKEERCIKYWQSLWDTKVYVSFARAIPFLSTLLEEYSEQEIIQAMDTRKMIVESDRWYDATPARQGMKKDIFNVLKHIPDLLNSTQKEVKDDLKPLNYAN